MRLTIEGRGLRCAGVALAIATAVTLAGCSAGDEGTYSPDSLTCAAAQSLFGNGGAYDEQVVQRLADGVPSELRSTAERLASFPETVDEWQRYDADLASMQHWAVGACGTTVSFPVELSEVSPRLADYLSSVSSDGDTLSVIVSGAPDLDAATELCEQAVQEYAKPGIGIALEVRDSFGILLALGDGDRCIINPEFTG